MISNTIKEKLHETSKLEAKITLLSLFMPPEVEDLGLEIE